MKLRCKFQCNGYFFEQCTAANHREGYIALNLNFCYTARLRVDSIDPNKAIPVWKYIRIGYQKSLIMAVK